MSKDIQYLKDLYFVGRDILCALKNIAENERAAKLDALVAHGGREGGLLRDVLTTVFGQYAQNGEFDGKWNITNADLEIIAMKLSAWKAIVKSRSGETDKFEELSFSEKTRIFYSNPENQDVSLPVFQYFADDTFRENATKDTSFWNHSDLGNEIKKAFPAKCHKLMWLF